MPSETDYVDGTYLQQNPDWHVPDSAWKIQQILKILRRNQVAPATVYEVGCGAGELLRLLQQNLDPECEFWGSDVSPQAIELCRSRANNKLRIPGLAGRELLAAVLLLPTILRQAQDERQPCMVSLSNHETHDPHGPLTSFGRLRTYYRADQGIYFPGFRRDRLLSSE